MLRRRMNPAQLAWLPRDLESFELSAVTEADALLDNDVAVLLSAVVDAALLAGVVEAPGVVTVPFKKVVVVPVAWELAVVAAAKALLVLRQEIDGVVTDAGVTVPEGVAVPTVA